MLRTLLHVAGALLIWWLAIRLFRIPHYIVPAPGEVIARLFERPGLFLHHASITALEIVLALLLGTLIGFATGIACWRLPALGSRLMPALAVAQALPVFAIAPLLVTWLGYGLAPKIAMATLIVFFPVTLATLAGLSGVPDRLLDQARLMRARPLGTFLLIVLPTALATIAVGLRLAAVSAPIGAIVGEWVGAAEGLGFLMLRANQRVDTATLFAALFILVLMTLTLHAVVTLATRRLLHWLPNKET